MSASFCGHQKVVELLIRAGANVSVQEEVSIQVIKYIHFRVRFLSNDFTDYISYAN